MRIAYVIDGVRSPMALGKPSGHLARVHPVELLSQTVAGLLARHDVDPGAVDDVVVGCVNQVGEQGGYLGRLAWLAAGFPEHVPSVMINRQCGSGQQALQFAANGVRTGEYDLVVAAGVESMSRVRLGSARSGADWSGQSVTTRYHPGLVAQGISAELIAARWGIDRDRQDAYSVESHHRAAAVARRGGFDDEIVPIVDADGVTTRADQTIRPTSTARALAALPPAFVSAEAAARFPEIRWSVTAGNSSQITDGAAAILVASERAVSRWGLRPCATVRAGLAVAGDPITMLAAPVPATRRLLERTGLTVDDIELFEVNEAFAVVPLAWRDEFGVDPARLNPRGGAIALGHPLGASGVRLALSLLRGLAERGGRFGMQVMCEAGGMANATLFERVDGSR